MQNTMRTAFSVAALAVAAFWFSLTAAADSASVGVSRRRFGTLRREDMVVTEVRGVEGVLGTGDVVSIVGRYCETNVVPRLDGAETRISDLESSIGGGSSPGSVGARLDSLTARQDTNDTQIAELQSSVSGLSSALAGKQDSLPYDTNAIPQSSVSGLSSALAGKQDSIDDLAVIRYGADLGATAVQPGRTVNGHPLSEDVTVSASDVGLGDVVNTGDSATPVEGGTTKFTTGGAYTELAKKADKSEMLVTNVVGDATKRTVQLKAGLAHDVVVEHQPLGNVYGGIGDTRGQAYGPWSFDGLPSDASVLSGPTYTNESRWVFSFMYNDTVFGTGDSGVAGDFSDLRVVMPCSAIYGVDAATVYTVVASRKENPIIGYMLGRNNDKIMQPALTEEQLADIGTIKDRATSAQGIKADNALSRKEATSGFTEWEVIYGGQVGFAVVPAMVGESSWALFTAGSDGSIAESRQSDAVTGDSDVTELLWDSSATRFGVSVRACRTRLPTIHDIQAVRGSLSSLWGYSTNTYELASLGNSRVKAIEAWQYTDAVTRADLERGMTDWAVAPMWPLGSVEVGQVEGGADDGKWALFRTNVTHSSENAIFTPTNGVPDSFGDVMSLEWRNVSLEMDESATNDLMRAGISWDGPSGGKVYARFDVYASRVRVSTVTDDELAGKQDVLPYDPNSIPQSSVSGLSSALAGKQDVLPYDPNSIPQSAVSGLSSALAGKQDVLPYDPNSIPQSSVSGLSSALAGKQGVLPYDPNAIPQAAVSGLSSALAGKQDSIGDLDTIRAGAKAGATAVQQGRTVNGHPLSDDVTVSASDVGLGNVVNTGDSATPVAGGTDKFTTGGAYTELAKKADRSEMLVTNVAGDSTKKRIQLSAGVSQDVVVEHQSLSIAEYAGTGEKYGPWADEFVWDTGHGVTDIRYTNGVWRVTYLAGSPTEQYTVDAVADVGFGTDATSIRFLVHGYGDDEYATASRDRNNPVSYTLGGHGDTPIASADFVSAVSTVADNALSRAEAQAGLTAWRVRAAYVGMRLVGQPSYLGGNLWKAVLSYNGISRISEQRGPPDALILNFSYGAGGTLMSVVVARDRLPTTADLLTVASDATSYTDMSVSSEAFTNRVRSIVDPLVATAPVYSDGEPTWAFYDNAGMPVSGYTMYWDAGDGTWDLHTPGGAKYESDEGNYEYADLVVFSTLGITARRTDVVGYTIGGHTDKVFASTNVIKRTAEKTYAMFIIPLNFTGDAVSYSDIELKASTNNFSVSAESSLRAVYYCHTSLAPESLKTDGIRIYAENVSGDMRSYTKIPTGVPDGGIPEDAKLPAIVAIVSRDVCMRNQGGEWLYEDNDELIWTYCRSAAAVRENDTAGRALWRPIAPVKWFSKLPKWAE